MRRQYRFLSSINSMDSVISIRERGCDNTKLFEVWRGYCKLNSNKNLPWLNRAEGGLGGDDNNKHKQIRFSEDLYINTKTSPNVLCIQAFDSDDKTSRWTDDELADLSNTFANVLRIYSLKCKYIIVSSTSS